MERLPSGTVTFLFTDIEGSTPLWDAHPAAMRAALARHDEILRAAIDAGGGYVFATGGDGFCMAFHRAGSAVAAAMAAQSALLAEPWPEHGELRVRMGLHSGEAEERDGNYFGPAVNRAARLMGAANGGQVVASAVTAGLVDDDAGVVVHDLGAVRLKGLVEPVRVFGLATPEVPWLDVALVSRQTSAGNLPRPQTDLVGDLVDLQKRVATLADNRLVTLTGSGGVGKTRAAVEIGWLVLDEFPEGAWLIELAPVADPALVEAAIASELGVQPQPGMTLVESIVDWCTGRRVLLIIDNCEHVLDPVVEVIDAIVAGCPTATVLATSREPLGVAGEYVVRIPSLEPVHGAELFRARAAAAGVELAGTDDEAAAVEAICARLDGIPLAIEIAAARSRSLTPSELLVRLDDRFRLLRGGGRGIERHQTLRATVTWSYQLLADQQRLLFDRLSVFAGGFDLATAEAICSDDLLDELDIIDLLSELIDKSMVIADRTGTTTRYRLLETLRQYGEERLTDRNETVMLRDRHLQHFAGITRDMPHRHYTAAQPQIDVTITAEWDNLRAAHGWAITSTRVVAAADIVAGVRGTALARMRHEASDWADQTLAVSATCGTSDWRAFLDGSYWAWHNADFAGALALARRSLETVTVGGADEFSLALATAVNLRATASTAGDASEAIAAARTWSETTDDPAIAFVLLQSLLDFTARDVDAPADAARLVEAARATGSPLKIGEALRYEGNVLGATAPPDPATAIYRFRESLEIGRAQGSIMTEGWARTGMLGAAALAGRSDAGDLGRAALRFANDAHYPLLIETTLFVTSLLLYWRTELSPAAVILGYCDVHLITPFPQMAALREDAYAAIADLEDVDERLERGGGMTRTEIVAYADASLAASEPTGGAARTT